MIKKILIVSLLAALAVASAADFDSVYEQCITEALDTWEDCVEYAMNHTHGGIPCLDLAAQQAMAQTCHWAHLEEQRQCYWAHCPVGEVCTM